MTIHLLLPQILHNIHHPNIWQSAVGIAMHQVHQTKLLLLGIVITLQRRRGSAHQHFALVNLCQHHRSVPGMIAWSRVNLLVRTVVLLIHNNQTQILIRQQQSRAGAQNQLVFRVQISFFMLIQHTIPDFHTLILVETRVIHPYPITEKFPQAIDNL